MSQSDSKKHITRDEKEQAYKGQEHINNVLFALEEVEQGIVLKQGEGDEEGQEL